MQFYNGARIVNNIGALIFTVLDQGRRVNCSLVSVKGSVDLVTRYGSVLMYIVGKNGGILRLKISAQNKAIIVVYNIIYEGLTLNGALRTRKKWITKFYNYYLLRAVHMR